MNTPNAGKYQAKVTTGATPSIYKTESGALRLEIPITLTTSDVAWSGLVGINLVSKNQEIEIKNCEKLRQIAPGWTSCAPWPDGDGVGLIDALTAPEVLMEVDCEYEPVQTKDGESKTYPDGSPMMQFRANWVNPIGGSMHVPIDTNEALDAFGGKFKALFGGKTAMRKQRAKKNEQSPEPEKQPEQKEPTAPAKTPEAKPATSGPSIRKMPVKQAQPPRTSTIDESWNYFMEIPKVKKEHESNGDDGTAVATKYWYPIVEGVKPGVNQEEFTVQDWGQVMAKLEQLAKQ